MNARGLLLLTLLWPLATSASQERKEDWPEGSAMHTGFLAVESRDRFEVQLADEHASLLALVDAASDGYDTRLARALRALHDSWLAYRSAECEAVGALTGAGGTWPSTWALLCESELTQKRYQAVKDTRACIERIAVDERSYRLGECLDALMPLAEAADVGKLTD